MVQMRAGGNDMTDEELDDLELRFAATLTAGGGLRAFARAVEAAVCEQGQRREPAKAVTAGQRAYEQALFSLRALADDCSEEGQSDRASLLRACAATVEAREGLGVVRAMPTMVVYDRSETTAQSLLTDGATFGGLLLCIWFSQAMGGGVWEFVTLVMFTLWTLCQLPWERVTRTTKLTGKAAAKAWAEALPADEA